MDLNHVNNKATENLDVIIDQIRLNFSDIDAAREKALPLCRETIRHCSLAIRAVHRQEFDKAKEMVQSARNLLNEVKHSVDRAMSAVAHWIALNVDAELGHPPLSTKLPVGR